MLVDKIPVFMGKMFEKGILFLINDIVNWMVDLHPSWRFQSCMGRSAQSKCTTNRLQHYTKNGGGRWQREEVGNWSVCPI